MIFSLCEVDVVFNVNKSFIYLSLDKIGLVLS